MNYNNTQFLKELKTLIEKEKRSNYTINGKIINIENNKIDISIKEKSNLTKNQPVEINRIKATVFDVKNKHLQLNIEKETSFKINQKVTIQNIQKDIIIHKLQETYDNIINNKINQENKKTLDVLFNNIESGYDEKINFKNNKLNKNQKKSVVKSLSANKFHLIQGPPGTGKTHTIIEIIKQLYKKDNRILITTHTHIALDNILERLKEVDEKKVLRIGEKNKVSEKILKYTMQNQIKHHESYSEIINKENEIKKLYEKNSDITTNTNKTRFQEDNIVNKIFKYIFKSNEREMLKDDSITPHITQSNKDSINELKLEIESIKKNIQADIVNNTKIFASTVISSSSYITKDLEFDYVIMDEASQVPVYLALIPLMKTTKFILIGDNKQLQPIQNLNSSYTLNKSIFNLLINKYPKNYTFLNIQYRMNQQISDISSKLYYDGKLLSDSTVKNQKIKLRSNKSFLLDDKPITLIDTSGVNYNESNVSGGCCNKYESRIILNIIGSLKYNGINQDEIGIITPYKKQKLYLQKLLYESDFNVECDTIYRFQGREKDVIIVSFCKSSNNSLSKFQKKFLADENQLNVSITRARKKLILVCNRDMIQSAKNIDNLFKEISFEDIIFLQDFL